MCIAAAIGGAALLSTGVSIYEGNKASSAQQQAAQNAQNTQLAMYNQTRADQAPFRQQGVAADAALGSYYGLPGSRPFNQSTLQNLPGYQFQLQQGVRATDMGLAASGLLHSGAAGKALTQYGQGLAGQYGQVYAGGLQNLAALGEGATQATNYQGGQAANQISNAQIYGGQAAASGSINTANAITSGLDQGIGLYGLSQGGYFNQRQQYTPQYQSAGQFNNQANATGYGLGGQGQVPSGSQFSYQYLTGQN